MMTPEGIRVVEIDLNLPNAFYYLHCVPDPEHRDANRPRALLNAVRRHSGELGWRVWAGDAPPESGELHLLFETAVRNMDEGLARLLPVAGRHRVRLVQPGETLERIGAYIRRRGNGIELPEIHYGLFVGDRSWADSMLDKLSRSEAATVPVNTGRQTLTEIARGCSCPRDAVAKAYRSRQFSLKDIAEYFGLHFSEVSEIINASTTGNHYGAP